MSLEIMEPKIVSIAIGTYNRATILPRAIDSCLHQTFPKERMQIIIVDDHSLDNAATRSVIEKYIKQYPDIIKAYYHEENTGPGGPRNTAIDHLDTKYVLFLDDDDFLAPDALDTLINIALEYNTDLIEFETQNVHEADGGGFVTDRINLRPFSGFIEYKTPKEKSEYLLDIVGANYWSRLYLSELLIKHNIRFTDNCIYEEAPFILFSRMAAAKVYHLKRIITNIVVSQSSVTRNVTHKDLKRKYNNLVVCENAAKYFLASAFKETYYDEFIIYFLICYVRWSYISLLQFGFCIDPEVSFRILSNVFGNFPSFEQDLQNALANDANLLTKIGGLFQTPYPGLPDNLSVFSLMFTLVTDENKELINSYWRNAFLS